MQTSASPWGQLAPFALLATLSFGCATGGPAPTCLGRYEIVNPSYTAARKQAGEAGDALARRLGRRMMVTDSKFSRLRVVLDDDAAEPSRVKVVVVHGEGESWSVSVVKATPEEDERVRLVRAHVELALKSLGVRWTYDLSDQDLEP